MTSPAFPAAAPGEGRGMTPREDLETLAAMHLEVAAYVEKLSGPDREVDAKIAALLGSGWMQADAEVPAYTGSLHAAMRLVPEPLEWEVSRWRNASKTFPWLASSKVHLGSINEPTIEVFAAATPALALCAAALRARASALTGYGEKG